MKIHIPPFHLESLFAGRARVWLVGGAVRDLLLGRTPEDWDLSVDLSMDAIVDITDGKAVGPRGRQVCVFSRRGWVFQTSSMTGGSICRDLARRDFTVNAMAADMNGKIYDPFGGAEDLAEKRLRFVPSAEERLLEDPLRALRLARFSAALGFAPDPVDFEVTGDFVKTSRDLFLALPSQRVGQEMRKGLAFPHSFMETSGDLGILDLYLPSMDWPRLSEIYRSMAPPWPLSWALGAMESLAPGFPWEQTLRGWDVRSKAVKEARALGSLLPLFAKAMSPLEAGRILLKADPSVLAALDFIAPPPGSAALKDVRKTVNAALKRGAPLSAGLVAEITGPGPWVKEGLDFVLRLVLSDQSLQAEKIKELLLFHVFGSDHT